MNKAEYKHLYSLARRSLPRLSITSLRRIRKTMISVADNLASAIKDVELRGLSDLTAGALRAMQGQLNDSAIIIQQSIEKNINSTVTAAAHRFSNINEDYLIDIIKETKGKITKTGIKNMFIRMDDRVITSVFARVYSDGYSYSERIWRSVAAYGDDLKNVVSAGFAQGRDIVKIAKDIQVYVRSGREVLVKRYGDLKSGSREFIKRIGKKVEYNALRLLRSELYASLQDSARLAGLYNPGCNGMYDWVRGGSQDWNCDCPAYAAGSPYTLENLPDYPHPNCLCSIVPVMRNRNEFVRDLRSWADGNDIDYLDNWYNNYY